MYTCQVGVLGRSGRTLALIVQLVRKWAWLRMAILLLQLRLRLCRGCQVRRANSQRLTIPPKSCLNANPMPYSQKYSHYLPLKPHHSRTASRAPSLVKDGTRSPKEKETRSARNSSVTQAGKRRSTMNSREAGYNEAEALRRAIEASKEDAAPETGDGSTRRAKRGRSDSEE